MPALFFDTETTGLPNYDRPVDHPSQPHIVQLAAILVDDDGIERASLNTIIKPHDALVDVHACRRIYDHLQKIGKEA